MNMTQNLQKWGNGTGVRIPKKVVEAVRLEINQPLEISIQGDSIVLTPVNQPKKLTLEALFEGVKPSDIGGEMNWGPDVGAERIDW